MIKTQTALFIIVPLALGGCASASIQQEHALSLSDLESRMHRAEEQNKLLLQEIMFLNMSTVRKQPNSAVKPEKPSENEADKK